MLSSEAAHEYLNVTVGPALRSALMDLARRNPKPENPLLFLGEALSRYAESRSASPSVKAALTTVEAGRPTLRHLAI
jgi:hypothetical protein